jgi:hypothetical protein
MRINKNLAEVFDGTILNELLGLGQGSSDVCGQPIFLLGGKDLTIENARL